MERCKYITQEEIKNAFKKVVKELDTTIISALDLAEKVANELNISVSQLKANYLVAFLSINMQDHDWELDKESESFSKIEMNETAKQVIRGLQNAGWPYEKIQKVIKIIKKEFKGKVGACNLDSKMVAIKYTDVGMYKNIYREDL